MAALLLVAMALPGCYVIPDFFHHDRELDHWWHSGPAQAGYIVGYAPLAPFAYVEAWCMGHDRPSIRVGGGPFQILAAVVGGIVGKLVELPFYAVTRPFELLFGAEKKPGKTEAPEKVRDEGNGSP